LFIRRYAAALAVSVSLLIVSLLGFKLFGTSAYALPGLSAAEYREDINQDGSVNIVDVIALLLLARDNPTDPQVDYNGDGRWSITDAIAMLLNIRDGNLTPLEPAALSGAKLLNERCTVCHTLDWVETAMATKDRSAWEVTVDRMIGKGAVLDETEKETLLNHLHGGSLLQQRCTVCHTLDRVNDAVALKDRAAWETTVDRMIGQGAQFDQAEKETLLDYLVSLGEESEI
jgi:cytochrome c5